MLTTILLAATLTAPADARVNARVAFALSQAAKEVEADRSAALKRPCPNGGGENCKCGCRDGGICTCAKASAKVACSTCEGGSCSVPEGRLERSSFTPTAQPVIVEHHELPPGTVIWHSPVQTWTPPPPVYHGGSRPVYRMAAPQTFSAPASMSGCAG